MEKRERNYLTWLMKLVEKDENEEYRFLLEVLWKKEFYSLVNYDDNRAQEGMSLRSEAGFDHENDDFGPCRCLEMLIFLARRCEFQLYNTENEASLRDIFWEFIRNLGLEKYSKMGWNGANVYFEIDEILNIWLERRYDQDGFGGIFPLKAAEKDQNQVEIWYQMQAYLLEKERHEKPERAQIEENEKFKNRDL